MITYLIGDAAEPRGDGFKIIAHVVNDVGAWGAGFSGALSAKWPQARDSYIAWKRNGTLALGTVSFERLETDLAVAHMCAQWGLPSRSHRTPCKPSALYRCLSTLGAVCRARYVASVHMPRIGCGLGGRTWGEVEPIIKETLADVDVFVYDLPTRQRS